MEQRIMNLCNHFNTRQARNGALCGVVLCNNAAWNKARKACMPRVTVSDLQSCVRARGVFMCALFCLFSVALLALGGCLNQSNTLTHAGNDPIPDLNSPMPSTAPPAASPASLKGLDRRNWDVQVVDAPRGQVQARPTYSELLLLNGTDARDGKTFPTVADSLYLSSSVGAAATEGAADVVWPAFLLVVSPVRMATGQPPWLIVDQPMQAVGVLPASQTRASDGLWKWVSLKQEATAEAQQEASQP